MKRSGYEGLQKDIRGLKTPAIEVWRNQYPDKIYTINLDIPEFTCICPKTGLPDFAVIRIEYFPAAFCVELKSFKKYINRFRGIGIFHEHVVNKVLDDFAKACEPRRATLKGVFNPRGGIHTVVSASYEKPQG